MSNRDVSFNYTTYICCSFYGNENSEYCYIPILKNAHLWGVEFFSKVADFKLTEDFDNKKFIVFVRDPKERWFSGIAQWFTNNLDTSNFELNDTMIKMILSAGYLDNHSTNQFTVLEGIKETRYSKITFFKTDEAEFYDKLKHFVHQKMKLRFDDFPNPINVSEQNVWQNNIRNQLKQAIAKNISYTEQLDNLLKKDYDDIKMHNKLFYRP
jgi:hypothetical protein